MTNRVFYLSFKIFLAVGVLGLSAFLASAGQAKESLRLSHGQAYLSSDYIADYIIAGLLAPEVINRATGKIGRKVDHPSTFLWRGPVSFSFEGQGVKEVGGGAFYAAYTPVSIAGLAVEQVSENPDIKFIIQNNIIEETIEENAENLKKFSLEPWLYSEVKKHISKIGKKKCFWLSYPNEDGIRVKAVILLNSELGHNHVFQCTEKAILEILGFYNFHQGNKYHRILDLIALQVLYDLYKSKSPFDDIAPKKIKAKIRELIKGGQFQAYLNHEYVSQYIMAGLHPPESINRATGKMGRKVHHLSTFLWQAPISFRVDGDGVKDVQVRGLSMRCMHYLQWQG